MSKELYKYTFEARKKTFNNPEYKDFIKNLKVGDEVIVIYYEKGEYCTVRKVTETNSFFDVFDVKLDNGKWYRNGDEKYEVVSQYFHASECLLEFTQEFNELLGDSVIKACKIVDKYSSVNFCGFEEEMVRGAFLHEDTDPINEEEIDRIVDAYNDLSDIEKHEFKLIIQFDEKSEKLGELLKELNKLEDMISAM